MSGPLLVSVIIPVGDAGPHLRAQIDAVLGQVIDGSFEVVVSVNTPDPVQQQAVARVLDHDADDRVRAVDSSGARGAAHARNVGVSHATSDTLAFCDADDLVADGWLAALVAALDDADAVTGYVDDERFCPPGQLHWRPPTTPGALPQFLGHPYLLSGNLALKRAAFEAVGGFRTDLSRCEDIAVSWELQRLGYHLAYAPDAILYYRHRAGLWPMLRQHYGYGVGMAEVLARIGVPTESREASGGRRLLQANGQQMARRSLPSTLRRASIAAGRAHGLVRHSVRHTRRATPSTAASAPGS